MGDSSLKNILDAASASTAPADTTPSNFTYEELLALAFERRRIELEKSHPGQTTRNNNIAGNVRRAVNAFMKANDLQKTDLLGPEIRDETAWEAARDRMGPNAASQKSLAGKARTWALEAVRAANILYDDETFGMRLTRLREASGLTQAKLTASVSNGYEKIGKDALKRWEQGRRHPSASSQLIVERMEEVLGVPHGTLTDKMPKVPYHSASTKVEIPRSLKRRLSPHLPHDFDIRPDDEQEEIASWIAENILSTPKEVFDDGTVSRGSSEDVFIYALARKQGGRCKMAPPHLISELDRLGDFKTAKLPKAGMKRGKDAVWSKAAHEKADYDLRAFFGALNKMGLPTSAQSLSILIAPEAIERFIEWRYERRGAYTGTLLTFLQMVVSFLQPDVGFLTQIRGFGCPIREVPGFISKETADLAATDWEVACARAKAAIYTRVSQIEAVREQGRDPFEAILPVVDAPKPLFVYWKIVDEIRARMPGSEYRIRVAECLRSLAIIRIALGSGLRSKNLRELLFCPKGGTPKTEKELRKLKRGEMRWKEGCWWIAIPDVALKNRKSKAVEVWNEFPLEDPDGKLDADISKYLTAREDLLSGHPDPGTLFVKTLRSRAKEATYDKNGFYTAFRAVITTYGIYNPYTGRGAIKGLRPHGPHSVRHVLGTHLIKNETVSDAAAALFDTEIMSQQHYGRYAPSDRHRDAMRKAWSGFPVRKIGGRA
ncbi:helix-turn-helix domain-containing protein [Sulfitobacter sp. 1A13730]|uniref:helix-turn-helix domain-containing protein n=1 Tax=Sulfitobacter sp. 1A13730 TaxID=3368569 RepID=UPI00374592FF